MSKAGRKELAQKRKKKKFLRSALIALSIFVVVDILFALGFCLGLRTTQQATAETCYTITVTVENLRLEKSGKRRYLRFSANGEEFSLRSAVYYYDVDQIAQELQDTVTPVRIAVFEPAVSLWGRCTPATIYDDETIYFDMADFNAYQTKERASLYLLAALFGALLLACHVAYYVYWRATKPHHAKKNPTAPNPDNIS